MMYQEYPFLDRFAVARADGFRGVEFMFPYDYRADQIAARLIENSLTAVLFNAYPGDLLAGQRGLTALPGHEQEFAESIDLTITYAQSLQATRVHFMAGLVTAGTDRELARATYVENLRMASARLADHDLIVLIEPINTRDIPDYFLTRQDEAHAIVAEINAPNLKVQMDFYHTQVMEGDLATKYERFREQIGHVQVAGVPGRNEPDTGEINYTFLFDLLDRTGYTGWVGCEYRPSCTRRGGTTAGLGWFNRYRS